MSKRVWTFDPHSGGQKIPDKIKDNIRKRIEDFAAEHYAGKYTRLDIRFRGQFCYIDAYTEPLFTDDFIMPPHSRETKEEFIERLRNTPTHLCRLPYFDDNRWSMAFYTYSNEKYTPSMFNTGSFIGTPEEGFDTSAVYLT